jgi:ABC-2 type transport system ATP-binding protein
VTVLLTSHDLADVERLADRIGILDRGRLVAMGDPAELTSAAGPVLRFRLATPLTEPDRALLAERLADGRAGVGIVADEGAGRYRLDGLAPAPAVIAALAAWCEARGALIVEMRAGAASLEERYLELTGSTPGEDDS